MKAIPALMITAYVSSVLAANIVTSNWGLVAAGFGLLVPAGTYCAGLALALRDAVHEWCGVRWVWAAIAAGTALSFGLADGRIALASGVAFALSEALDLFVYSRLRVKGWRRALLASNAAGAVVDTALFLWLSGFGITAAAMAGQLLVKTVWVATVALLIAEVVRRAVPRQPQFPSGA